MTRSKTRTNSAPMSWNFLVSLLLHFHQNSSVNKLASCRLLAVFSLLLVHLTSKCYSGRTPESFCASLLTIAMHSVILFTILLVACLACCGVTRCSFSASSCPTHHPLGTKAEWASKTSHMWSVTL